MGSCFGKLFQLPSRRCSYSSVMIHAMLVRKVATKKRYEVWPVFGGNPWRFSLVEFGAVTGLPRGEFANGYVPDFEPAYKEEEYGYWDKLFDCRRDITIPDLVRMVTEDLTLSRGRRLRLCLIIIIDGVLKAATMPVRPTMKHVKLVENLKEFLSFPWGRESFFWTVRTMIPEKMLQGKVDDPEGDFCTKLRQKTKKMGGFPLALQLAAYEMIPQLLARLSGNDDEKLIDFSKAPQHRGLTLVDVLEAEHHPEVSDDSERARDGRVLEVIDGGGLKELADKAQDESRQIAEDFGGLDKLVGDIVKEHGGAEGMGCVGSGAQELLIVPEAESCIVGPSETHLEDSTEIVAGGPGADADLKDDDGATVEGNRARGQNEEDQSVDDVVGVLEAETEKKEIDCPVLGEPSSSKIVEGTDETGGLCQNVTQGVTYLSDTSPCPSSEKHKPEEDEAHLASLLLAKEPFSMGQIFPGVEDTDFGYFEQVLLANPKALHLGVGLYDLDNEFFLDLATPQKWVSTKHMEVLVDFLGEWHAELLRENRTMFVAPWFMEKLVGKAKTFKSSAHKEGIF
ncbi:hypothetical protein Bca52824_036275 [Brassica carinata]|uniref:DUF1985 domain-containing protein n=1 Tax=Brassica carinata TaxID=52824 RepID=A0A8X7S503_BRACI|nr:hypothetical protein Bca52824_036275 [Brassica carinata]